MRYEIWTNETIDKTREYIPSDDGYKAGAHMKLAYSGIYSGPFPADTNPDNNDCHPFILESLFETFNIHHPADYEAHSLSVGDIVVLMDNGRRVVYACDRVGFKQLPYFDPTVRCQEWIDTATYFKGIAR